MLQAYVSIISSVFESMLQVLQAHVAGVAFTDVATMI
jgi:hypothetical protein